MYILIASGKYAVPTLIESLNAGNPQVRSRAIAILRQIGPDAKRTKNALKKIIKTDKWYIAYEADQALRAIDPGYKGKEIKPVAVVDAGADVSVRDDGKITTISNGIIEMVFENGNDEGGPKIIRRVGGDNLVDGDWLYRTLAMKYSKGASILERRWNIFNSGTSSPFRVLVPFSFHTLAAFAQLSIFILSLSVSNRAMMAFCTLPINSKAAGVFGSLIL